MNNKSLVSFKIENTCITDTDLMWFDYYVITQRNLQALVSASSFGKDKHFCCGHRTELQFLGKGKSGRYLGKQVAQNKIVRGCTQTSSLTILDPSLKVTQGFTWRASADWDVVWEHDLTCLTWFMGTFFSPSFLASRKHIWLWRVF